MKKIVVIEKTTTPTPPTLLPTTPTLTLSTVCVQVDFSRSLIKAAKCGNMAIVRLLLEKGAKANYVDEVLCT